MLRRVVAGVLINQAGELLILRRQKQKDWVLPGQAVEIENQEPAQADQDCLHQALRHFGVTFDQARLVGYFTGHGLVGWPAVELFCFRPERFSVHDQLGLGLEWITPADLPRYHFTEVEQAAIDFLLAHEIWSSPLPLKAAV